MKIIKKNIFFHIKNKILNKLQESYKNAVIIVSLAAILLVCYSIFALVRECQEIETYAQNKAKVIASLGRLAVQEPLWDLDFDSIDKIINSLFYDNEVTSVKIKSYSGETLFEKTRNNKAINVYYEENIVKNDSTETGYSVKNQNIGKINIGITKYFKEKDLIDDFIYGLIFLLIFLLLVYSSIKAIFYQEKSNQNKIRTILDNMTDSVITTDTELTIKSCNQATEKMFGYKPNEIIGKKFSSLVMIDENFQESLDEDNTEYYSANFCQNIKGLKGNGDLFPVEFNIGTITLNNEKTFIIVVRDITIRNEVSQLKDEFVSVVSHELRTPLTSIIASLRLVTANAFGEIPETCKEMLNIALNSSNELLTLINNILDIDKINNKKVSLHIDPVKINDFIKQIINNNKLYAEQHKVNLLYDEETYDDLYVMADKEKLGLVLTNLLSNAAKFSPENSEVKVFLKKSDDKLRISVSDNGVGINDEDKEIVFEKFVQIASSSTRKKGGSGLGLYISKVFIELMDGIIKVEDNIDRGSIFYVELPLANTQSTL